MRNCAVFGFVCAFAFADKVDDLQKKQAELEAALNASNAALAATNSALAALQHDVGLGQTSEFLGKVDYTKSNPSKSVNGDCSNTTIYDTDDKIGKCLKNTAASLYQLEDLKKCVDFVWILISGALVMFMQAGFAILEAGACRQKHAAIVAQKNVLDACLGAIVWYVLGYGLAYGIPASPNEFIGTQNFVGSDFREPEGVISGHYKDWFFQWAFCATAATIVSGAVAERIEFTAYVSYSVIMTGVIYPVVVWWTWSGHGWLTNMGYDDFAGSGIVHLTGGSSALVGAIIVGKRKDWTPDSKDFAPHNMSLVVLGTFILWFGWYGFNCGSTLTFSDVDTATVGALAAMNTTIAAAVGGLTIFFFRLGLHRNFDLAGTCNGILAGLVAVCAGVGSMEPHAAILVGFLGGLGHEAGSMTLKKLGIDDPLDAFAVHGCGGIVGLLLRPLVDASGANGEMFGVHCLAIVVIFAWSGGLTAITFGLLRLAGKLRTSDEEQEQGSEAKMAQQFNSPPKDYTQADHTQADPLGKPMQKPA